VEDALLFSNCDFNGTEGSVPFPSQGPIAQFGIDAGGLSSVVIPGGTCLYLSSSTGFKTTLSNSTSFCQVIEGIGFSITANNDQASYLAYYAQMDDGTCGPPPPTTPGAPPNV
jgi:hypothetical protein